MSLAEDLRRKLYTDTSESITCVIYARVSTDNDGQKESCANQVELANRFIARHPNIQILGTFVDDGISAKNDFTRPEYNKMLELITEGKVDLIIAKALSRLNRSDTTSSILKELCISTNTTILTLEDNQIQDFDDPNSEMMYGFKSIMDAQYVRKQSINGRKTHELRCANKILSAKDCSFGYDWHKEGKTITINKDQAKLVVDIFEDYVYRNGTPASISEKLEREGYKFPHSRKDKETGEKYTVYLPLSAKTIGNIIEDERYIGKFYINKRSTKLGTGKTKSKRIKHPKDQWVLIERPDLRIIDDDLFEMAQRLHQTRITVYAKNPDKKTAQAHFQGIHKYAGKIFCSCCGKPFHFGYADRKKTVAIYRINSHSKCPSPVNRISEADMDEITRLALKKTIDQQNEVCTSLERVLTECVEAFQNNGNEIDKLKEQKKSRERQLDNLMDTLSEGGLTDAAKNRIKEKLNDITTEIDNLNAAIQYKESSKLNVSYVTDKIAEIKAAIADLRNFTSMDRDRILNYIDRIEMKPNGDVDIILKSGQRITMKPQNHGDFSEEGSVDKTGRQDGLYS
jgi:site-specific DNA recombinase